LNEISACGRCGARAAAGAQFCHSCGQSLTTPGQANVSTDPAAPGPWGAPAALPTAPPHQPSVSQPAWPTTAVPTGQFGPPAWPTTAVPTGQPGQPWLGAPGQFGPPPAGAPVRTFGPVTARPAGIALLAIVEVVVALVGLTVVLDLWYWADWRFTYDDFSWGMLDAVLAVAYLITSTAGFILATKLWGLRAEAWQPAIYLSIALLALDVASIVIWGVTGLDVLGICVHLSVIWYLNMAHVRALFGRPPSPYLQGRA
jgi:hypothetical protein